MIAAFAEWRPDVVDLDAGYSRIVKNVVPKANSYGPFPSQQTYTTTALAANAYGLTMARTTAASWAVFAGTATKLYKLNSLAWTDVTRTVGGNYGVAATELWRFAQFGTYLYAVNVNDAMQRIDVDAGSNFAAVAGSPPNARNIAVVGDFVVLSNLASDPYRIQWSAINDPTGWTVGTNLSDYQTFGDGGRVAGVAGGEVGYVLQEYAVRRMRFQPGSDYVFTFERVVDGKGCISPYGFCSVAGVVFFLAEDGFYSYSQDGLVPLGASRINKWFQANSDTARVNQVLCVADPVQPIIYWHFYASSSSTTYDLVLIYDWSLDRFTYAETAGQVFAGAATPGVSLDSLSGSIDAMTVSFDSRAYLGGRPTMACIGTDKNLAFLSGDNLAATLETAETHVVDPGRRGFINQVYLRTDATNAAISVGMRDRVQDAVVYGSTATVEETGWASVRASGRLGRFQMTIPAGSSWSHAQGVDFNAKPDGMR